MTACTTTATADVAIDNASATAGSLGLERLLLTARSRCRRPAGEGCGAVRRCVRASGPAGVRFIATVAQAKVDIARYLAAARTAKALLILDLQPGRAGFLTRAKRYEKFLRQPDAQADRRDRCGRDQRGVVVPRAVDGQLAPAPREAVHRPPVPRRHGPDRPKVVPRQGLAMVVQVDGFGRQRVKRQVYGALNVKAGPLHNGLNLFLDEDTDMLTPYETMAFRPRPPVALPRSEQSYVPP